MDVGTGKDMLLKADPQTPRLLEEAQKEGSATVLVMRSTELSGQSVKDSQRQA